MSTDDKTLYEFNKTNEMVMAIAPNVTNETVFQTVDFQGNTSTSSREHYVAIKMTCCSFLSSITRCRRIRWSISLWETEMTPRTQ